MFKFNSDYGNVKIFKYEELVVRYLDIGIYRCDCWEYSLEESLVGLGNLDIFCFLGYFGLVFLVIKNV